MIFTLLALPSLGEIGFALVLTAIGIATIGIILRLKGGK